jgi:hypothetical protein
MNLTLLCVIAGSLLLAEGTQGASPETCVVAPQHDKITFPVEQLTPEARCLLADVIDHPSTTGVIGPNQTPIGIDLYGYLLDHPVITARLMARLGMGTFQIIEEGVNRYRVNDGEGAEGSLSIVSHDRLHRIYYIDGEHRSTLFPTVKAKTAVFLQLLPRQTAHGRSSVETLMVSYTRFDDGILARVLRLFKPFVTRAVTGALAKELSMTHRLGLWIVDQPQRVLEEATAATYTTPADRQTLLSLLEAEIFSSNPRGMSR